VNSAVTDSFAQGTPRTSTPLAEELELRGDRKTPIAYFVPQLTVGGTENQLVELVLRLDRSQFHPTVWCPGPWGPAGDRLLEAGIAVRRIRLSPRRPISFLRAIKWLRAMRPLIFHSYGYGSHWLDVLAARLAGVQVILTSRRNVRHWDAKHRLQWCERLRNRWTRRVIVNSEAVAAVCAEVEHIGRDRIQVIYNGVEQGTCLVEPGLRVALRIGPLDLLVGNVANMKPVKGQDILIRAFREVVNEIPQAYLVICGEGEMRDSLERLRRELALEAHVFFLGLRHDVMRIYSSLDLYAHSSRAEGLPTSVLEAMAHGLPVVATSAGGTRETLPEDSGPCLVPPDDAPALAKAIVRLLKDEYLRIEYGLAGRQHAASRFAMGKMVAEHESLYLKLLGRAARSPARRCRSATAGS